jgi:2-polyprenyl-3-methyl-5-hydroxy-6-metoxy-1,4-benzoquinol methylase
MSVEQKVRDHFHADALRFDAIYEDDKNMVSRWVDGVWRGVVRRRFDLTMEKLRPQDGKTVLDVGCGSGRYCVAYAQSGAERVVGVDFAETMIDLANEYAGRAGVSDRCEFRAGRFPDVPGGGPFDVCTAMGFFDYIAEPGAILSHMREMTRSTMILSFPKSKEWRAPVRRLRFRLIGCPLFLYTKDEVEKALSEAGIDDYEIIVLDRDYIVIARF